MIENGGASRDRTDDLIVANDGVAQAHAFSFQSFTAENELRNHGQNPRQQKTRPTLRGEETAQLRVYFDPEYLKVEAIPKVIPAAMLEWFDSPEGNSFKKELVDDDAPDAAMRDGIDRGTLRHVRQVVACLASKNAELLPNPVR